MDECLNCGFDKKGNFYCYCYLSEERYDDEGCYLGFCNKCSFDCCSNCKNAFTVNCPIFESEITETTDSDFIEDLPF